MILEVRTSGRKTRGDLQLSLAVVVALELVLQVTSELSSGNTEQVFDEVTGEADTLVGVVVLVVWLTAFGEGHLEDLADDAAEVDGLLLRESPAWSPKVREQFAVEQLVDPLLLGIPLLTGLRQISSASHS